MISNTRMIILLCLISSLGRFALDSYLPSLPAIGEHFGISGATSQYTLTVYLLGFSFSQLIYGPLSDHYGRRITLIVGLLIFIIGGVVCMLAPSENALLVGRAIAGVGAGACGVLNRAIASDCFQGPEFSKAWSYTTTSLVVTLCLAPLMGGVAEQLFGWRANFGLSTFYVVLVLGLILKFLPETYHHEKHDDQASFHIRQVFLSYLEVLKTPSFLAGTLCYTLAFAGVIAYFQMSPMILIEMVGLSPTEYGLCSFIIACNYLFGGYLVNQYVSRIGVQAMLVIGTLLLIVGGMGMMLVYEAHTMNIFAILLAASVYILGARIIIPNAIATSMKDLRHLGGSSSALIGCIQMLGSTLVSLIIAALTTSPIFMLATVFILLGIISLMISLRMARPLIVSGVMAQT
jgi:Bcr/CflA subfamily drug resistance transporter